MLLRLQEWTAIHVFQTWKRTTQLLKNEWRVMIQVHDCRKCMWKIHTNYMNVAGMIYVFAAPLDGGMKLGSVATWIINNMPLHSVNSMYIHKNMYCMQSIWFFTEHVTFQCTSNTYSSCAFHSEQFKYIDSENSYIKMAQHNMNFIDWPSEQHRVRWKNQHCLQIVWSKFRHNHKFGIILHWILD